MQSSRHITSILLVFLWSGILSAQENPTCFDFHRIEIPLNEGKLKTSAADVFFQPANNLDYGKQDSHTFWYLLKATESTEIRFSIFSLNYIDIYDPLLFSNEADNICTQIVSGNATPLRIAGKEAYSYGDSLNRQNVREFSFMAEGGLEYYLGVIEIFGESCGHKLFLNTESRSAIFKAIKKDCIIEDDLVHLNVKTDGGLDEDSRLEMVATDSAPPLEEAQTVANDLALEVPAPIDSLQTAQPQLPLNDALPLEAEPTSPVTIEAEPIIPVADEVEVEVPSTPELTREAFTSIEHESGVSLIKLSEEDNALLIPIRQDIEEIETNQPDKIDFRDWETGEIIPVDSITVGQQIVLNKIYFHNNTFAFKFPAQYELEKLAEFLIEYPKVKLEIQGHSAGNTKKINPDPRYKLRGEGWNFKGSSLELSQARSDAVKSFLVEKGIDGERLSTVGLGDKKKLVAKPMNIEEARLNMRVEIVFTER